jgi:hypothetical protein
MEGYKHLIECHCVLPQYRNLSEPVFHKFVVFSEIDDSGAVVSKLARCENCGAVHKVHDICSSEIMISKEESRNVMTKRDISPSLPKQLIELLEEYQLGTADYEAAKFYIEHQKWGSNIILTREPEEEGTSGKLLVFVGPEKFRIDPYFDRRVAE